MKIEDIVHNNQILAKIFYKGEVKKGAHFYTSDESSLQVGKHLHFKNDKITPHKHMPVKIVKEESLQEVLCIERGKVKITFFSDDFEELENRILHQGDVILIIKGGHNFEFLEETEMIEVKQGPYNPDSTIRFEGK